MSSIVALGDVGKIVLVHPVHTRPTLRETASGGSSGGSVRSSIEANCGLRSRPQRVVPANSVSSAGRPGASIQINKAASARCIEMSGFVDPILGFPGPTTNMGPGTLDQKPPCGYLEASRKSKSEGQPWSPGECSARPRTASSDWHGGTLPLSPTSRDGQIPRTRD